MSRVNTLILTESQCQELEDLYKTSTNHVLRKNCHLVLLKADGRTSKDIGSIVDMCDVTVNTWLQRYKDEGVQGLVIKSGRGRKAIIQER